MTPDQYETKIGSLEDQLKRAREAALKFDSMALAILIQYAEETYSGGKTAQRIRQHIIRAAQAVFGPHV